MRNVSWLSPSSNSCLNMADVFECDDKSSEETLLLIQLEKLQTCEKYVKTKVINDIYVQFKNIFENQRNVNNSLFNFDVVKLLIEAAQNSPEKCREIVVDTFRLFIENSAFDNDIDIHLVGYIKQSVLDPNTSEELRLQIIQLFSTLLNKRPYNKLEINLENIFNIIKVSMQDSYSEVVKETANCFLAMNSDILRRLMYTYSESLIEVFAKTLFHHHYKVRVLCINSISVMAMHADAKFVELIFPYLAQTLLDEVPQVRLKMTEIIGKWMVELPNRHYLWERLIALFLPNLSDEVPDVRSLAEGLWCDAGEQYEMELEAELEKELLNLCLNANPEDKIEFKKFPVGCQIIVSKYFPKLLAGIKSDLSDWMDSVKLKASHLLCQLILNAKSRMALRSLDVIEILILGVKIENSLVYRKIIESTKLFGYFTPINIWCPVILKAIEGNSSLESLRILENLLSEGQKVDKMAETEIINTLCEPNVYQTDEIPIKESILSCIGFLLDFAELDNEAVFKYFLILVSIYGTTESLSSHGDFLLSKMSVKLGYDAQVYLWNSFGKMLIEKLTSSCPCDDWTENSLEWKVFNSLLLKTDLSLLFEEVKSIFDCISKLEENYVMKFHCLKAISFLFESQNDLKKIPDSYFTFCIKSIIFPNLIWRPGHSASTVRAAAATSLFVLIANHHVELLDKDLFAEIIQKLTKCCEDDNSNARISACKSFDSLINNYSDLFDEEQLLLITSVLIGRLEDIVQDIRLAACHTLGKYLKILQEKDVSVNGEKSYEKYTERLSVYLNDSDDKLQSAVEGVFKGILIHDENHKAIVNKFARLKSN